MAGYSGTPLAKKLGIKPASRVALLNAPKDFEQFLDAPSGSLPDDASISKSLRGTHPFDIILLFATSQTAFTATFDAARARMAPACGLWCCWPKKASGMKADLTEDIIRDLALATGLVDNKVCAIDDTWSGLRIVIRTKDRRAKDRRAKDRT